MSNIESRNFFLDYLKGITIFLVVWGHAIQFAPHSGFDFFQNHVFIFIYSFHMPLFMFISGYLFVHSIENKKLLVIKNKFNQIIIPILCWSFLYYFILFLLKLHRNNGDIGRNILTFLMTYLKSTPRQLWFLWAIIFCVIIVAFCNKYFKDNIFVYLIIFILLLFTPDYLNLQMYKYMYPYFVMGYLYNIYKLKINIYLKYIQTSSLVLFPLLLLFWSKDYYIYTTGMSIFVPNYGYKLLIIFYRYIIGFAGTIFIISIAKLSLKYHKIKCLATIGRYTLGIYILQNFTEYFYFLVPINSNNLFSYNYILTPIVAILFILVAILIVKIIQKNKYTNKLFLGGK